MKKIDIMIKYINKQKDTKIFCPCKSGKTYDDCCKPYHLGQLPDTALKLMRSRYSAYALCLPEYIISTTHPDNPQYNQDKKKWFQQIFEFCSNTEFENLEILHFQEKDSFATVTFVAYLIQNNQDVSFKETSCFEKIKTKWLYRSGVVSKNK